MLHRTWIAAAATSLTLAACGETTGEQALIGAGAGAGASILLDTNPIATAAVGAAGNVLYCQQYPSKC